MIKQIYVTFNVDIDAVSGWFGSYGGENSPDDISRGMFAGEIGVPCLLKLFKQHGLTTTWFVPGHSAETFSPQTRAVADDDHELELHGYSYENPIAMTPEREEAVLDKSIEVITMLAGKPPTGYVAPWWEFSPITHTLLIKKGMKYDHSLIHNDFHPYYVRADDKWTKIGYSKHPDAWMKPLERGAETPLVEIPAIWYLDDLPPMIFIKNSPNSHGFVNPRDIEQMWRDQFDWVYREHDDAVFPHHNSSRRVRLPSGASDVREPDRAFKAHEGVRFATYDH